jgi:hypothetical protein
MSRVRWIGGWLLGIVATGAIVGLSRVPYAVSPTDHAELRFAWRYRSVSLEQCRPLTEEENAALPAHMRQDEICERRLQPWRLTIWVDGVQVAEDTVRARGAREDRPLYVFRKLTLAPGTHAVRAIFAPIGPSEQRMLSLESGVSLDARQVALVTYDPDTDRLVLRDVASP